MRRSALAAGGMAIGILFAAGDVFGQDVYSPWPTDALDNPNFFPIGVWYQTPDPSWNNEIAGYKAIGVNVFDYVDPTTTQTVINDIGAAGMYAVIDQGTALGEANINNKTIIAWFNQPDEPDNAQPNGSGGYGDPVLPAVQISQYQAIKAADPTRPVLQDLGQGVAWAYYGRGSRTGDFQDYPYKTSFVWTNGQTYTQGYLAACDIGAFDIYPVNSTDSQVSGNTSLVGYGVSNLEAWSKPGSPVWNYIETTQISAGSATPTPQQTKAEVWLSLVNGSNGIMYFADSWNLNGTGTFSEDALLQPQYSSMASALTTVDAQIESLAPELNSATHAAGTIAAGTSADENVEFMTKEVSGNEYLFCATAQNSGSDTVLFYDPALSNTSATVTVLGESRTMNMVNGAFTDTYTSNDVHLYEIAGVSGFAPELVAPSAQYTWAATGGGSWATTSNWTSAGVPAVGGAANFNTSITSSSTINLSDRVTLAALVFDDSAQSYTIAAGSGGTLTLSNGSDAAAIFDYAGNHFISAPVTLSSNTLVLVNTAGNELQISGKIGGSSSLTLLGSGTLLLGASNSYTGGTTISSGTLIANVANSLPTNYAVVNNSNLVVNATNTAGAVSGTGSMTVAGAATFTASSFTQGSLVNNGTTQINGAGTLGAISGTGSLTVGTGSSNNTLQIIANSGQSSQTSITVAAGSTLDITNNSIVLTPAAGTQAAALAKYLSLVKQGYNSGSWTGTGITSSAVAAANAVTPLYGIAVAENDGSYGTVVGLASGQIEIAAAVIGDATLSGTVNFADFVKVEGNYGLTGADWDEGDFYYTGTVNFADFVAVEANFGDTNALSAAEMAAMQSFAGTLGDTLVANPDGVGFQVVSVPEPASAGLLALVGAGLLARRRRRQAT